jgi:peroxiredoxin
MSALTVRQWNMLLLAVLVAGSLFIGFTRATPQQSAGAATSASTAAAPTMAADPAPLPNHPAPEFTLTALDGSSVALSELEGQVVLVNVWATWCPPCRAEMPAIQAAYEQHREEGFVVLAVNAGEDSATVAEFMHAYNLTFPALLDPQNRVSAAYAVNVMPSSFFIDRQGYVRSVYRGPLSRSVLDGVVTQLLAEDG